jgi:hypothetical protein
MKHIRNIAASLGTWWGLDINSYLLDLYLGHVPGHRTTRRYVGKVRVESLVPIANLIGKEYMGGDRIKKRRRK